MTLEARHKISVGSEVPAITAAAPGSPSHSGTDTKKEQQEIALVQVRTQTRRTLSRRTTSPLACASHSCGIQLL